MVKDYKQQLKNHIKALDKGYENVILILNQDPEKDDESGDLSLSDDKIKSYIDGVLKAGQAADSFLAMIKVKNTELDGLNIEDGTVEEKKEDSDGYDPLNDNVE